MGRRVSVIPPDFLFSNPFLVLMKKSQLLFNKLNGKNQPMSKLPKDLPTKIKNVLEKINFQFDNKNKKHPYYFALYSLVNMQGWDIAQNNLKDNLSEILKLVREDQTLTDRKKKFRELSLNIDGLELHHDFYSEEFFSAHKSKYLRTVKSLTRGPKVMSYRNFRYSKIRNFRQAGPRGKGGEKVTIPDEETRKMYEAYLIEFEKNKFNPNLKEYQKQYRKVNPRNLKRFPISEVYQYLDGEVKLVFKNQNIRKNSLERNYSYLKNLCHSKASSLNADRFSPYGFIAVPDYFIENYKEISTFVGGQVAGLAGSGGANYYDLVDGEYVFRGHVNYWRS